MAWVDDLLRKHGTSRKHLEGMRRVYSEADQRVLDQIRDLQAQVNDAMQVEYDRMPPWMDPARRLREAQRRVRSMQHQVDRVVSAAYAGLRPEYILDLDPERSET